MPTSKVKADENGRIIVGDLCAIPLATFEGLEVTSPNDAATGKAIKVADHRMTFLGKVDQHNAMCNYTVSVVVTREAVTDAEETACKVKLAQRDERKAKDEADEKRARKEQIQLVQDAERAAADRAADRAQAVLDNTIRVLTNVPRA